MSRKYPKGHKPWYADLHEKPEDERIREIGQHAMKGEVVSFVTDDDDGKLERYLLKLLIDFPILEIVERGKGPVAGTVWAKVRKKQ